MHQLIDEPTNIRGERKFCIDLIIRGQRLLRIRCATRFRQALPIPGCLWQTDMCIPLPPPFLGTIGVYSKSNNRAIIDTITLVDWLSIFNRLGPAKSIYKWDTF